MAIFKKLNNNDVSVSPLTVHKNFKFFDTITNLLEKGISFYKAKEGDFIYGEDLTNEDIHSTLLYNSIKHLYYSNYITGEGGFIPPATVAEFNSDGTITGPSTQNSNYNYESTTLWSNREFDPSLGEFVVISISSLLYGDNINPKSFSITNSNGLEIKDDGEGRLISNTSDDYIKGNIIYEHGIIILFKDTDETSMVDILINSNLSPCIAFQSTSTILENQYKVSLNENEFNYSQNPTIASGSNSQGEIHSNVQDPSFSPYITTVGLYNDDFELMALAKLAKPLPTSSDTDISILINIDR